MTAGRTAHPRARLASPCPSRRPLLSPEKGPLSSRRRVRVIQLRTSRPPAPRSRHAAVMQPSRSRVRPKAFLRANSPLPDGLGLLSGGDAETRPRRPGQGQPGVVRRWMSQEQSKAAAAPGPVMTAGPVALAPASAHRPPGLQPWEPPNGQETGANLLEEGEARGSYGGLGGSRAEGTGRSQEGDVQAQPGDIAVASPRQRCPATPASSTEDQDPSGLCHLRHTPVQVSVWCHAQHR